MDPAVVACKNLNSATEPDGSFEGIWDGHPVCFMVGCLLQPISIEADAHIVNDFVRRRVVDMNCLSRLCAALAEAYEGVMIDGIPKVMEARTELHPGDFIGHRIVGFDNDIMVAQVHRLPVAVWARGHGYVQEQAMRKDSTANCYRFPLHARAQCQIGETMDRRWGSIGEIDVDADPWL